MPRSSGHGSDFDDIHFLPSMVQKLAESTVAQYTYPVHIHQASPMPIQAGARTLTQSRKEQTDFFSALYDFVKGRVGLRKLP